MDFLLPAVAIVLATLFISGWLLLLLALLVVASATAIGGLVSAGALARRLVPVLAREPARGILCIEGLASDHATSLRRNLARVLRLAPQDTRPRACACVKEVDGAFVGVLRIFNMKGHYLLRAPGSTAAAVARHFNAALADFRDRFPADVGARRAECPECVPRSCPLRRRARLRPVALTPA